MANSVVYVSFSPRSCVWRNENSVVETYLCAGWLTTIRTIRRTDFSTGRRSCCRTAQNGLDLKRRVLKKKKSLLVFFSFLSFRILFNYLRWDGGVNPNSRRSRRRRFRDRFFSITLSSRRGIYFCASVEIFLTTLRACVLKIIFVSCLFFFLLKKFTYFSKKK